MKYRLHKLLAFILVATLLCVLWPMGAMATNAQPVDLMRLVGTSRSEVHSKLSDGSAVVALAFRFRMEAKDVKIGTGHTTVTDNATVSFDGNTYRLVSIGALMTNKAEVGLNPNAFQVGTVGVTNVVGKYLFTAGRNYAEDIRLRKRAPRQKLGYRLAHRGKICRPLATARHLNGVYDLAAGNHAYLRARRPAVKRYVSFHKNLQSRPQLPLL